MSRPSCFIWCAAPLVAGLIASVPADARNFVLRPDGSGDVATFQAGVDSLVVNPSCHGYDTLFVYPGVYDEDVVLDVRKRNPGPCDVRAVVFGPGAEARLRSMTFPDDGLPLYGGPRLFFEGLTLVYEVRQGNSLGWSTWTRCRFEGGFASYLARYTGLQRAFEECEFTGPVVMQGVRGPLLSCWFMGCTARVDGGDNEIALRNCVFVGPADTAVVATMASDGDVLLDHCSFSGFQNALAFEPEAFRNNAYLLGCVFRDIANAAVGFTRKTAPTWPFEGGGYHILDCHFERCGAAIQLQSVARQQLWLARDTITECTGVGFEADVARLDMKDCVIASCGAAGTRLNLQNDAETMSIVGCRFSSNRGDGLTLAGLGPSEEFWGLPTVSFCLFERNGGSGLSSSIASRLANSTSVLNRDAGITLHAPNGSPFQSIMESNLVAGNDGPGLVAEGADVAVRHNDAWMNQGGDYLGVSDLTTNLTRDTEVCDPLAGDFRVASTSPCAPSGPYGQIGALGVGCDVMTVPLAVQAQPVNPRSNAPVEAAILGHRLFDARRVDPVTVALSGAPPSRRGLGKPIARLADANADGFADLTLYFDARDLHLADEWAELTGSTHDGAAFHGSDAVEVKGARAPPQEAGRDARQLGMSAAPSRHEGRLTVVLDLVSQGPATLDLFDVAGRRMRSCRLEGLSPGRTTLQLVVPLRVGLYLLRLRQGREVVVTRAVVIR